MESCWVRLSDKGSLGEESHFVGEVEVEEEGVEVEVEEEEVVVELGGGQE